MPKYHPGFKDGYFYGPIGAIDAFTSMTVLANRIYFCLTHIPERTVIDRLGLEIVSTDNSNFRIGIYKNNDREGRPEDLLVDAGELSAAFSGRKEINLNLTLYPGWYWLACLFEDQPGVRAKNGSEYNHFYTGTPNVLAGSFQSTIDYTYGPLPQTVDVINVSKDFTSGDIVFIWFRKGVNG